MFPTVAATLGEVCSCGRQLGLKPRKRYLLHLLRSVRILFEPPKICSKTIAKRLTVIAEALLLEEQNRFRKGRSCMDCIFSASQLKNIENSTFPHMLYLFISKRPLTLWT